MALQSTTKMPFIENSLGFRIFKQQNHNYYVYQKKKSPFEVFLHYPETFNLQWAQGDPQTHSVDWRAFTYQLHLQMIMQPINIFLNWKHLPVPLTFAFDFSQPKPKSDTAVTTQLHLDQAWLTTGQRQRYLGKDQGFTPGRKGREERTCSRSAAPGDTCQPPAQPSWDLAQPKQERGQTMLLPWAYSASAYLWR